jgi:ABC-type metal ion transport system substrate-binding protein
LSAPRANPYANVRAMTQALAHDPHIERLSVPLQSESVADFIRERDRGSVIPGPPASSASAGGRIIR